MAKKKEFRCGLCGKWFDNQNEKDDHKYEEHYELVELDPVMPGDKEFACDGCVWIKVGRQRDGFPDSKSRSCIATARYITGCVVSSDKRMIWKRSN